MPNCLVLRIRKTGTRTGEYAPVGSNIGDVAILAVSVYYVCLMFVDVSSFGYCCIATCRWGVRKMGP